MKKIVLTILIMCFSLSGSAQHKRERIKTLKIAYITEQLDLTQKEAEQFWPIYNAFENEQENLRKDFHALKRNANIETMTDKEAKANIKRIMALEERKYSLQVNFMNDLLKVLPEKKVIVLHATEESFKRRMLQEMRNRRENFRKE